MSEEIMETVETTVDGVEVIPTVSEKEGFGAKDVLTIVGIAGAGYIAGTYVKKGLKWVKGKAEGGLKKLKEKKAAEKTEEPETESKEN